MGGKIRYEKDNLTAVMIPAAALLYDTTYTAAITVDGTRVVQDIAGNSMQETLQWRFTTNNTVNIMTRRRVDDQTCQSYGTSVNNWNTYCSSDPEGMGNHFDMTISNRDTKSMVRILKAKNLFEIYVGSMLPNGFLGYHHQ